MAVSGDRRWMWIVAVVNMNRPYREKPGPVRDASERDCLALTRDMEDRDMLERLRY